jgi:hypothetical protein
MRAWIEHGPHGVEGIKVFLLFFEFHETMPILLLNKAFCHFAKIPFFVQVVMFLRFESDS